MNLALPVLVCLGLAAAVGATSIAVDRLEIEKGAKEQRLETVTVLGGVRARLEGALYSRLHLIRGLGAFARSGGALANQSFQIFAHDLLGDMTGVLSLQLAPGGIVSYVYPEAPNRMVLGHNIFEDRRYPEAVRRAAGQNRFILAGPVRLMQGGRGILGYLPVYVPERNGAGQRFWGFAIAVMDLDTVFRLAGLAEAAPKLELAIRGRDGLGDSGEPFLGDPALFDNDAVTAEIALPDGKWVIAARPREGWSRDWAGRRWLFGAAALISLFAVAATALLAQKNHSLRRARERAEKALEQARKAREHLVASERLASLGAVVAGVAHEINTPVGVGVTVASALHARTESFVEAVSGGQLRRSLLDDYTGAMKEGCDVLLRTLRRASDLVGSFRQLAVDQSSSQRRSFHLSEVLNDVTVTMNPVIRRGPFRLDTRIDPGLPLMDSYPGPLGQILTNLIANALTHAFDGREEGRMLVTAAEADGHIRIEFSDDGVGMTDAVRRRVFDPFFTTKLGQGGSGLGLNLVHNFVTGLLGGTIEVESEPGRGATFRLSLPLAAPRREGETPPP